MGGDRASEGRSAEPARPLRWLECRPVATPEELRAYQQIRRRAFVEEQHLFDGSDLELVDDDPRTLHIVAVCEPAGEIAGVVRCAPGDGGAWFGGRLVVTEQYRASRLLVAPALVRTAEKLMQDRGVNVFLGYIRMPIVRFFEHLGWIRLGQPVDYAGTPHQLMRPSWSAEPAGPIAHDPPGQSSAAG